jgi:hypothetical protein
MMERMQSVVNKHDVDWVNLEQRQQMRESHDACDEKVILYPSERANCGFPRGQVAVRTFPYDLLLKLTVVVGGFHFEVAVDV